MQDGVLVSDELKKFADAVKSSGSDVSLDKLMVKLHVSCLSIVASYLLTFSCTPHGAHTQAMADLNADKKVSVEEFTVFLETLLRRP